MVGPVINNTVIPTDSIQSSTREHRQQSVDAAAQQDHGWFLPGNNGSLTTINASAHNDLAGASPDAMASQVLSHIGT